MVSAAAAVQPLWFLDTLVRIHVSHDEAADGLSLVESYAPYGDSPPLHVHYDEDELFYVLDGELQFHVGDRELHCSAGEALLAPKGIPHTYRVCSPHGGRWLVATSNGDFERLIRTLARPAEHEGLPKRAGPPTPESADELAAACLAHRIELVGPPLQ